MDSLSDLIVRVPVFGGILRKLWFLQTLRVVYLWMEDGVPHIEAFRKARDVAPNAFAARIFNETAQGLSKGGELWEILGASGEFPPVPVHSEFMDKRPESVKFLVHAMIEAYEADLRFLKAVFTIGMAPITEATNLMLGFVPLLFTGLLISLLGNL